MIAEPRNRRHYAVKTGIVGMMVNRSALAVVELLLDGGCRYLLGRDDAISCRDIQP